MWYKESHNLSCSKFSAFVVLLDEVTAPSQVGRGLRTLDGWEGAQIPRLVELSRFRMSPVIAP